MALRCKIRWHHVAGALITPVLILLFQNCGGFQVGSEIGSLNSGSRGPSSTLTQSKPQYLTWDGGSGPNKELWSLKLELKWKNALTGDWLDANQVEQGTTPYAATRVSAAGPVTADVTGLVSRWISNGYNKGFLLKTTENAPFVFDGRTAADATRHPQLEVVTDRGTFKAPPLANANWTESSFSTYDSRASFQVSSRTWTAIVQFDLTGIVGTVQSAKLTLHCKSMQYAANLNIFEANPPMFRDGGGGLPAQLGIAASYPLDKNLQQHPSVLFAGDFSDLSAFAGSPETATKIFDAATQSTYLRGNILKGELQGGTLERDVVRGKADGTPDKVETELYARYYVFLEDNWGSTVDANKMPGWDARMGYWHPGQHWEPTTGNGGSRCSGLKLWNSQVNTWEYQGCSLRGHGGKRIGDGNPYDELFWIGGYVYNLDQVGSYGEEIKWNGVILGKGRWYSIEQYVKMNSINGPYDSNGNGTGVKDGIYRVWVDGVLAYEKTGLRWRHHPEMGLQGFWMNWYHGGLQPSSNDMTFRMNHLVIAREYIGPRAD